MGLSGVQRTLKFAKYLPEFGWEPTVVTSEPAGYFAYDDSLQEEVRQAKLDVHRTSSWDPTRLFGRRKVISLPPERTRRALSFLSQLILIPDNKLGWWLPARRKALELHRKEPFDLIFSTAPPYTAHLIAAGVARSSGLPLVLDFRDDWMGNPRHHYPTAIHRSLSSRLEQRAVAGATHTIVINEVIRRNLLARNADVLRPKDVIVIPQGYDPSDFIAFGGDHATRGDRSTSVKEPSASGSAPTEGIHEGFRLLYSGVFYHAQTPEPFLRGLADFITRRPEVKSTIEAAFVGLLPESALRLADELEVGDLIRNTGYLQHSEAVAEILSADVLWMMIGRSDGAESISTSKLYEYFGARKPILGIVPEGAARSELRRYEAAEIADPDRVSDVSAAIERLYSAWERSMLPVPRESFVEQFDRKRLTRRLARLFDGAISADLPTVTSRMPAVDA